VCDSYPLSAEGTGWHGMDRHRHVTSWSGDPQRCGPVTAKKESSMALLHSLRSSAARFLHPGEPGPGRRRRGRGRGRQAPHRGRTGR
jgi:hypothetical protein